MKIVDVDTAATPWWRVGMVWLVVGGPLVVVVAAVVTAVIAVRGADPVLDTSSRATAGLAARGSMAPAATTPALEARNHAATTAAQDR